MLRIRKYELDNDDACFDGPDVDDTEIQTLADWPLLNRLTELNFCGSIALGTERLIAERLAPHVFVNTAY